MQYGVIGSGSWATALTKILTDNKQHVNWWVRSEAIIKNITLRHHNPNYLSSVYFDTSLLSMQTDVSIVIKESDIILIAIPSAYVGNTLKTLDRSAFAGKKVISAVKGILPESNLLVNDFLKDNFDFLFSDYFTVMGPCHAEEVAAEKLSYLTFSGVDEAFTIKIAANFHTDYLNTVVNHDVFGVQYAAILKNIYALGAGIAHGLDYGDNFLSVYIANSADEMASFLKLVGAEHMVVGEHQKNPRTHKKDINYAASVYL